MSNNGHNPTQCLPCMDPPSWAVIEQTLRTEGTSACRCALKIVFEWCRHQNAQIEQLQALIAATEPHPAQHWTLPGSIPATGVIHVPSVDPLAMGEES